MNEIASEMAAVIGTIDPDVYTASTIVTDYGSMADFDTVMGVVMLGTLGAGGTVNAKLVQATDSSGTGSKDITGKAITTALVKATDDDKQAIINCRAEELDVDNSFTHVALSITFVGADSDMGAILMGLNPRQGFASDNDLASVAEIVN